MVKLRSLLFYSFVIAVTLLAPRDSRADDTLRLSVEPYPPYVDERLVGQGVLAQIAREALAHEKVKVEIDFFPATRAFKLAESGKYDGSMPWALREERKANFFYGEPIIESDREVFFHKETFKFQWDAKAQNYEDLQGLYIGAVRGSNFGEKFQEAERSGIVNVLRATNIETLLRMLAHDRLDLVVSPERIALYALKTNIQDRERQGIVRSLAIDEPVEYDYMLISKNAPRGKFFFNALNRGLKTLKASGRHKEIIDAFMQRYGELDLPQ